MPQAKRGPHLSGEQTIRIAQSCATDPRKAVEEFHAGLAQPDATLVIFFCSSEYDREVLTAEMGHRFAGTQVVGCTTAGEIGPAGCRDHSIAGVSFSPAACTAAVGRLDDLRRLQISDGVAFARDLRRRLEETAPRATARTASPSCWSTACSDTKSCSRTRSRKVSARSRWSEARQATA